MVVSSFAILFGALALVLACTAAYIYRSRHKVDEMHGMMAGMAMGMLAGLIVATLYTLPTGDFLWGVILGSAAGLIVGVPAGKLGNHLGILEGVMAGPMGGMMGAMLGQMARPFNLEIFMPFFAFIILISLLGISYVVHCGVACCGPGAKNKKPDPVSGKFIGAWMAAFILILFASFVLSFPLGAVSSSPASATQDNVKLPGYLQQYTQETRADAVQRDGAQYASIKVTQSRYEPNVIVVKKGIPLKLSVTADDTAGCAREIVFPAFKIQRIIPLDAPLVLDIAPDNVGEFPFRCSMDMVHGKIIVTA
jgi:heme/copper-type cytochrome/quinol oxidase subunit 2